MQWIYNDGGRKLAGFSGTTSDCVARAIAIVTGKNYLDVYNEINDLGRQERSSRKRRGNKSHARTGVYKQTSRRYIESLGYAWTPTMQIGSGCQMHLRDGELPNGRLIVQVSRHLTAVIDGVIHDTSDCSRDGNRCVYGYFQKMGS